MADPPRKPKIIKSRSGCKACKLKRIKCDEAEPDCRNCVKRGISCPGYKKPLKWSTKHERFNDPLCRLVKSPTPPPKSTSPRPPPALANQDSFLHNRIDQPIRTNDTHVLPVYVQQHKLQQYPDEYHESAALEILHRRDSDSSVDDLFEQVAASDAYLPPKRSSPNFLALCSEGDENHDQSSLALCNKPRSRSLDEWVTDYHNYSGWRLQRPLFLSTFSQDDAHADKLMSHYFGAICRVMSCFDSDTNPYRTDIPEALHFSPHMFHCMMSMTAAHLTNYEGEMAITTLNYQTKAVNMLQEEMTRLALAGNEASVSSSARYQILLGTIILGMTSAWHDPSAYALSHLHGARLLFMTWSSEQGLLQEDGRPRILTRDESFIVGSMAYWESLGSFLVDQSLDTLDYLLPYCDIAEGQKIYPHSWVGISMPIFVYLAQVGTLLRQKRVVAKLAQIGRGCPQGANADSGLLADAEVVHSKIIDYALPPMDDVEETGDIKTPVTYNDAEQSAPFRRTQAESQQLVFDLATSALTVMSNLPRTSGIITVLAIAYISAGSALQNTQPERSADSISLEKELDSMRHSRSAVHTWRENVRQHVMHAFRELGIASIQRCAKLVQEAWTRSDIQVEMGAQFDTVLPVHWMDVMIDQKLETLYG